MLTQMTCANQVSEADLWKFFVDLSKQHNHKFQVPIQIRMIKSLALAYIVFPNSPSLINAFQVIYLSFIFSKLVHECLDSGQLPDNSENTSAFGSSLYLQS